MGRAANALESLLLPLMVLIGAIGVAFPDAGRAVDRSGGIDPTLAVLVLAAGLALEHADVRAVQARKGRIASAMLASTLVLPALAWALSRAAPSGVRDGILAVGVAPAEIASVGLTGLAGGEISVAAVLLAASSAVTVVLSAPILSLLAPTGDLHPVGVLTTLVLVVALPLGTGAGLARLLRRWARAVDLGRFVSVLALLALLFEVASEVRLGAHILVAAALLLAFLGGAALLGGLVTRGVDPAGRPGLLLPLAMRDFAVAAGIATAAFGPGAAGVLGIYGLLALTFGSVSARRSSRRAHATSPPGAA